MRMLSLSTMHVLGIELGSSYLAASHLPSHLASTGLISFSYITSGLLTWLPTPWWIFF